MSRLAELEAMVQAAWTRGTQVAFGADPQFSRDELRAVLAVYADELQELGDPRGELVALDLLRTPSTDDEARFDALRTEWLGVLATHPNVNLRYGLVGVAVTDSDAQLLQDVLASPAGRYVSSVSIFGNAFTARGALATLAREVRPWLGALRVIVPASPPTGTIVSSDLVAQIVEATPALYTLAIGGARLLDDFPHPTLRRLGVEGADALGALYGAGEPLANVVELELAFQLSGAPIAAVELVDLLPASHVPQLRRLDLARNERTSVPVYRFFRNLAIAPQLTHVRLPPLRTLQDRDLLQAAIDDMPQLEHLQVSKVYGHDAHGIRHTSATLAIPPPVPWLDSPSDATIRFSAGAWLFSMRALVDTMELAYERLPVEARVVWDAWWTAVATCEQTQVAFEFPARDLSTALDACGDALTDSWWRDLATELRSSDDTTVTVGRL